MIQATKITITRAEGPSHLCGKPHTFEGAALWQEADAFLRSSAITAPRGGGYDKHDITIEFGAGTEAALTYRTRYDLTYERTERLASLVRREWDFYAARWRPPRMTEAQHHAYLTECNINRELWALRCAIYAIPT